MNSATKLSLRARSCLAICSVERTWFHQVSIIIIAPLINLIDNSIVRHPRRVDFASRAPEERTSRPAAHSDAERLLPALLIRPVESVQHAVPAVDDLKERAALSALRRGQLRLADGLRHHTLPRVLWAN